MPELSHNIVKENSIKIHAAAKHITIKEIVIIKNLER